MWLYADFLGDTALQNTVIQTLTMELRGFRHIIPLARQRPIDLKGSAWPLVVCIIWEHTTDGPLRRWLVEEIGLNLKTEHVQKMGEKLPVGFLRELLLAKVNAEAQSERELVRMCMYHVHNDALPPCK